MVNYSTNEPMGSMVQGTVEMPLYQQIARSIADDIIDGSLAEGQRVPSTNEIAAFWRINPATAMKGLGILADDQIIYKQRGIGMFVAEGARAALLQQRREEFAARYVRPLIAEAARIGLSSAQLAELIIKEEPDG